MTRRRIAPKILLPAADPGAATTTMSDLANPEPAPKYQPGDWVTPTVPHTSQLRVAHVAPRLHDDTEPVYFVGRHYAESELRLLESAQ